MKVIRALYIPVALIFLALSLSFCDKNDDDDGTSQDPSNLTVEILSINDETGKVTLQANADNTVEYRFYLGGSDTPEETNSTGYFEYTFEEDGVYSIDVRAYGESGRYLKTSKEFTIGSSHSVPLDKGYFTPLEYQGYELVWNDEFDGNSLNTQIWQFEIGDGCPNNCGWGNIELEYYRTANAWVADDVLTIEARQENFGGRNYTSSRLITRGKKAFQYGRIDIRALLPEGQGLWPALWMLGSNFSSVGWPKCGEIDIMEMVGGNGRENTVHGTAHWDNNGSHAQYGQSYTSSSDSFNEAYHVFTIIWDESFIRWYVDDQLYNEISITGPELSEFHQPFFFIFNVAVGGNWPGNPDATTVFPQTMKVDYVRVFQEN
jgi:hypothetical protein